VKGFSCKSVILWCVRSSRRVVCQRVVGIQSGCRLNTMLTKNHFNRKRRMTDHIFKRLRIAFLKEHKYLVTYTHTRALTALWCLFRTYETVLNCNSNLNIIWSTRDLIYTSPPLSSWCKGAPYANHISANDNKKLFVGTILHILWLLLWQ